jgi:SrtB family sortase
MDDVTERSFDVTYPKGIQNKFKKLYAINDDVAGWIKIPGTSIDTVVLQGSNNDFYLRNDFYKNYTRYGNVYMDYRAQRKNLIQNKVLYAHTTESGEQAFSVLDKYKNPDFFVENPIIEFDTIFKDYKWKIFAVFMSSTEPSDDNGYVFYYIEPNINRTGVDGYLNEVKQRALYSTGVDVKSGDKILTLSTCTYDYGSDIDTRLVVVARLLRDGESPSIDQTKVIENNDYRRPQHWYDKYGLTNPYKIRIIGRVQLINNIQQL